MPGRRKSHSEGGTECRKVGQWEEVKINLKREWKYRREKREW